MENLIIKEINTTTGEIVERPMNDAERERWLENSRLAQEEELAIQEKIIKRQAAISKLAALGLDTDDLEALGL